MSCVCYIHETWIPIRVFSSEWIFRHGYYHGHCMDTLTQENVLNVKKTHDFVGLSILGRNIMSFF